MCAQVHASVLRTRAHVDGPRILAQDPDPQSSLKFTCTKINQSQVTEQPHANPTEWSRPDQAGAFASLARGPGWHWSFVAPCPGNPEAYAAGGQPNRGKRHPVHATQLLSRIQSPCPHFRHTRPLTCVWFFPPALLRYN